MYTMVIDGILVETSLYQTRQLTVSPKLPKQRLTSMHCW